MVEMLVGVITSPWIYLVLMLMIVADVVLPVLPSGTLLVTASVYAVDGQTSIFGLVAVAIVGSVLGDVVGYLIGKHAGARLLARFATVDRRDRMAGMLATRGAPLTILARFVPAGRTIAAVSASATGISARKYYTWSAMAALAWGAYSVTLGYVNGSWLGAGWVSIVMALIATSLGGVLLSTTWRNQEKKIAGAVQPVVVGVA